MKRFVTHTNTNHLAVIENSNHRLQLHLHSSCKQIIKYVNGLLLSMAK